MIAAGAFPCTCAACVGLGPSRAGITAQFALQLTVMEAQVAKYLKNPSYVFTVSSGRRCPAHNAAVGGAPDSMHLSGLAADLVTDDSTTRYAIVSVATAIAVPFIEVTPHHVHVDLRAGAPRLIVGANG